MKRGGKGEGKRSSEGESENRRGKKKGEWEKFGAMHFIYQIYRLTTHESRFNLFGLISQQCTTYMSCGRARMHDHRISSQHLTLSRHTGRRGNGARNGKEGRKGRQKER